jgi:predicted Zn-dependent protease
MKMANVVELVEKRPKRFGRRLVVASVLALAGLVQPTWAREGVEVGGNSAFSKLVPADQVERSASQQYLQMLSEADSKRALAHSDSAQLQRLRAIAQKIIPRAKDWKWEVNLIGSNQINAYCMPGGKIAFFTGILQQLRLTDDEVAMVMGHEIAHALREHARERMGKGMATQGVARLGGALLSSFFGIDPRLTDIAAGGIANLTTLVFSREDESEADLVGMELAARAGYDPRAGVTLWQKMGAASKGAPPQWLSTHPAGARRIADIQANLPKVLPLYERARVR